MTGVTFEAASETYGKRLQILAEIVPNLSRVAVLRTIGDPMLHLRSDHWIKRRLNSA
jgi:hypothetical protein